MILPPSVINALVSHRQRLRDELAEIESTLESGNLDPIEAPPEPAATAKLKKDRRSNTSEPRVYKMSLKARRNMRRAARARVKRLRLEAQQQETTHNNRKRRKAKG